MEATLSKKKKRAEQNPGKPAKSNGSRPAAKVRDYETHVLICAGGDCKKRGAKDTRKALKSELRASGLLGETRVDTVDCLGLCKHGPNAVVYNGTTPKGTWYLRLQERDVPEVVEEHLLGGEPVAHLAAERRLRKPKRR